MALNAAFQSNAFQSDAFQEAEILSSAAAMYLFLEDHYINGVFFQAGDTAMVTTTGPVTVGAFQNDAFQQNAFQEQPAATVVGLLPANWIPTPNVDPLNAGAVNAFYAAGPRDLGLVRVQWQNQSVPRPVTFWIPVGPNLYALTGLGASLPPVFGLPAHPVGNIPQ